MTLRALLVSLALLVLTAPAWAEPMLNRDYRVLDPAQHTDSPGKIEVLEFFSYGCPHCNEFHPLVTAWAAKLPKDVAFKKVATGFGRTAWTNLAKAYYALQSTGDIPRLDGPLFHAIHAEHLPLFDEKSLTDWVGSHGGNPENFLMAYQSFGVNTRMNRAEQMVEDYKIEGIPTLAVDGKYVVLGDTFEAILANATQVIAKARAEKVAAKK